MNDPDSDRAWSRRMPSSRQSEEDRQEPGGVIFLMPCTVGRLHALLHATSAFQCVERVLVVVPSQHCAGRMKRAAGLRHRREQVPECSVRQGEMRAAG
jgi:hypothetical protein